MEESELFFEIKGIEIKREKGGVETMECIMVFVIKEQKTNNFQQHSSKEMNKKQVCVKKWNLLLGLLRIFGAFKSISRMDPSWGVERTRQTEGTGLCHTTSLRTRQTEATKLWYTMWDSESQFKWHYPADSVALLVAIHCLLLKSFG